VSNILSNVLGNMAAGMVPCILGAHRTITDVMATGGTTWR
jgi:hypothetical protein